MSNAQLLTASQAARRLGVTAATVRRWLRTGLIPGTRLPSGRGIGAFRIAADDLALVLGPARRRPEGRRT